MLEQRTHQPVQRDLFLATGELPEATPDAFYRRVNRTLDQLRSAERVWEICQPAGP